MQAIALPMSKKEITIYDLADKLSLSIATVSRALNNDPVVKKKTLKIVLEAAKEMGYHRNAFASTLRRKKSNTIGVLVHELNSNFITSVLAGIEKVITEAGYDLIIAHSSESYEKEVGNAINLFQKRVDGVIASLAFNTENLDHFDIFHERAIPIVLFDRVEDNTYATRVIIDNYKCGYEATEHLIAQGCRRIVLITANLKRNVYEQRFLGYRKALLENGLPFDESLIFIKDLSAQGGIEAASEILNMQQRPDGIFITNDFSAAVCMRTLKENGICIPRDIAVVGFNDDNISTVIEPQLTTIRYPGMKMGETAATTLLTKLNGNVLRSNANTIIIESELIIRNSSLRQHSGKRNF